MLMPQPGIFTMVSSELDLIYTNHGPELTFTTEMPSIGRYYMLVLTSTDLLNEAGASQSALRASIDIMQKFPQNTIDLVILHPLNERFEWTDLPPSVKIFAEMRVYGLARKEDAYEVFGVSKDHGLIAVIRPDGYIGTVAPLQ